MRKPLLLICVICCLLLSGATPLLSAVDRQGSDETAVAWSLGSWFAAELPGLRLLPTPIYTNIFNDGPDPVESSEQKEDDTSEEEAEDDESSGGPTPFDSGTSGNISGSRE
jgi:hypothetical protein